MIDRLFNMALKIKGRHRILERMQDVGWAESSGFGPCPVKEHTLHYYQKNRGLRLSRTEVELIMMLSRAFIRGHSEGSKADYRPPLTWSREFGSLFANIDEVAD